MLEAGVQLAPAASHTPCGWNPTAAYAIQSKNEAQKYIEKKPR